MKLAIYGVSRSGKDYLINKLIKYLFKKNIPLHQIHGSIFLNQLSIQRFNCRFKLLSELNKNLIRKEFIREVNELEKEYANIIVDGHYSFYDEAKKLTKVFTEDDLNCYDLFFYLDTNTKDIIDRMRQSEGEKKNKIYTFTDIDEWKNYEVDNMTDELIGIGKELHIIKYEGEETLDYIYNVLNGTYDSKQIAFRLVNTIPSIDMYSSVILVDCDKTLSYEDTTSLVMNSYNIDRTSLKEIYKYDRYSNYQALKAKKYYESKNLFSNDYYSIVIQSVHFNERLIEDLKSKTSSLIIAITAGNSSLWSKLLDGLGLKTVVLDANFIVSKFVKYFVLKNLQNLGKYAVAIGDSMLDSLMLKFADKSYIIGNKGRRDNIQLFLNGNRHIRQLAYNDFLYDNIVTDAAINSIKCLNTIDKKINYSISLSKSDSGIEGKKLRAAHYHLGIEIAKLIERDYPNEEFVTIVMMRSGLCFGQGIADYFDCVELFYDDSNTKKFDKEFFSEEKYHQKKIILVDGVINSGKSVKKIIERMKNYTTIIATNVISNKFSGDYIHPIYATRISEKSFIGARQRNFSNGKGPDTSDRLFKTL